MFVKLTGLLNEMGLVHAPHDNPSLEEYGRLIRETATLLIFEVCLQTRPGAPFIATAYRTRGRVYKIEVESLGLSKSWDISKLDELL